VLILRDVLGWPAKNTADALDLSLAAANSALQRARVTMRNHLPDGRLDWRAQTRRELTADERTLVSAYMAAHERLDLDRLTSLLREDLRFAMPPQPGVWVGRDSIVESWLEGGFGTGEYVDWRCRLAFANGQPAIGMYLRRPGDTAYRALTLDVLRIADGLIAEITTFDDELFPVFGLPATLSG
jgi:RNA polymerase sigma-70 factor (ECF subfamily)